MKYQKLFALPLAALASVTIACGQAESPTSPETGPFAAAAPDGSTLKVTAPGTVSPSNGQETGTDPQLVITNSTAKFVGNLAVSYVFEVLNGSTVVYRSQPVPQGGNGRTEHEIATPLNADVNYTWRAYAVYQGQRGPMSGAAGFRTANRYGVSCAHTGTPIGIVACRFEQHGNSPLDSEETIQFMREVAYDLNQLNISDKGGFGLAVKTVGNNCFGYSCDIICEGQGSQQNQYDILIDEQIPNWGEVEEVTERVCEIIR